MSPPSTVVVVNPRSQGGTVGKRWSGLAEQIRRKLPFDEAITQRPGDATRLTREALLRGADRVVALGGDGTINEVVNGFFEDGARIAGKACFGVLPYGTGGDFRKTLGLSTSFEAAVDVLAAGNTRPFDVGRVDFAARDGGRGTRMFVNVVSFGLSGAVARRVNESSKKLGGKLSFLLATMGASASYQNRRVHLRCDGDDPVDLTVHSVAVANGRFFGGGMQIAPNADPGDGYFDVVVIGDFGMMEIVTKIRRLYAGTHLELDKISSRRATRVVAEAVDGDPIELEIDGETPGMLPATLTVLPRALSVIVP